MHPTWRAFCASRGHHVEVVVTAESRPAKEPFPVFWTPAVASGRDPARPSLALVWRHARRADVVYSTGMFGRSGIAAALARRPLVLKLTGDPAFERLRARGAVAGDVDAFQEWRRRRHGHRAATAP